MTKEIFTHQNGICVILDKQRGTFLHQNQNVRKATTSKLKRERKWTTPTMTQQPSPLSMSPTVTNIGRQAQRLLTEGEELRF